MGGLFFFREPVACSQPSTLYALKLYALDPKHETSKPNPHTLERSFCSLCAAEVDGGIPPSTVTSNPDRDQN